MATGTDFGAILKAAMAGGYLAHLTGPVLHGDLVHHHQRDQHDPGADGHRPRRCDDCVADHRRFAGHPDQCRCGCRPALRDAVELHHLRATACEGDGIRIVADGNDRWMYCWTLENVTVHSMSAALGLDVQGSVFEGIVSNSWMIANAEGGASFAHSDGGGQVSALRWFGGGFAGQWRLGPAARQGRARHQRRWRHLRQQCRAGHQRGVRHHLGERQRFPGQWRRRRLCFRTSATSTTTPSRARVRRQSASAVTWPAGVTLVGNSSIYTGARRRPDRPWPACKAMARLSWSTTAARS